MNYSVTIESLEWLNKYWLEHHDELDWEPLFVLPPWLNVWQKHFAPNAEVAILAVRQSDRIVGVAPLLLKDDTATIIGSPNVCDYEDFIIKKGEETSFFHALLDFLKQKRIKVLELGVVRPDSKAMSYLLPVARESGAEISCEPDEVSFEKDLPASWDDYLQTLDNKQRHEVRRKLRRLEEEGKITYRFVTDVTSVPAFLEIFLKMFVESREDKADFLTPQAEGFFRDLTATMAEFGFLRGGTLELDGKPMAAVLAFDYHDTVYLYNSGFDPTQSQLSVGILSKALLIKDSIERGKKKFDFLKGAERYKYHLGGKEVQLQKCRIRLQ
ncbi:MAG TPA: GNAT family N-acetyltransferase [Dehalococcoidales bacterium]